jgi:DNA modification methylase
MTGTVKSRCPICHAATMSEDDIWTCPQCGASGIDSSKVEDAALHEINALEVRIVTAEDDADAMLWEQARQVVALLKPQGSLSQRQLAAQWINGRTGEPYSVAHVNYVAKVYRVKFTEHPRPRFRDAYNEIANGRTRKKRPDDATTDVDYIDGGLWRLHCGDAWQLATAPTLPIRAIVTSPPYWRQRVYKDQDEFGQESVSDYIDKLVALFEMLKAHLRDDGALWINLGDSYEKDALLAIPARFMVAMIAAGWQLRSEVIYERLNMTPRPARKRPTRSHEHVLLFSLSADYYYDEQYMREPAKYAGYEFRRDGARVDDSRLRMDGAITVADMRNMRSVWQGSTGWNNAIQHPALMPKLMAERCVLSISKPGDWILDPFCGAATTGYVAIRAERSFIGWDIDARYIERAQQRLREHVPLLGQEVSA